MIYVQVSLILFLLISKALCIFNFTRHFGTKGLYPITTNTTPPLESPDSCVLVQLHLVARHGARFPTGGDVKKFDILDKLFANIPLAKDWQNPFNYSKEGLLTDRGENELYLLGQRARQRYYKFWNNLTYDPNVVEFKSSAVSRTGQSGISYAFGLFSGYGSLSDMKLQPIYISSVPRNQDRELSMHYACPLWLSTVKESSNFTRKQQEEKYLNSFISTISKRISDRLKIHPPLDPIHADYIYRACSFAVSFSNEYDTWCSLLEKDDFLKLEYFSDMGDFYSYAYGYQLNTKLACQFFSSFVESVESYLNGQSQVKSTLKFAHAETIIFLTTMLGLYEDDYPLAADTSPQQIASRKFRTSSYT
ncbi:phosphoglycerate mutase-like protein [Gigaspora margarita]|uniref:Multiple inositol polyphosphate phosphatase 1 n=1 Tax=Gigaspora margarita TaxID=4874 RepID=A0A8H3ZVT4_GIGMA|nr:phosphoglycerate mutase-like protein [Gigaspora margarita]